MTDIGPAMITAKKRAHRQVFIWPPILLALAMQTHLGQSSRPLVLVECLLVFFGGIIALSRVLARGFWSPAAVFFTIIGLFHLGLVPFWLFDIDPNLTRSSDYTWFEGDIGVRSLVIVLLAMVAYLLGVFLFVLLKPMTEASDLAGPSSFVPDRIAAHFATGGAALASFGVITWLVVGTRLLNWRVLFGSYSSWLVLTNGSSAIAYSYIIIGIGVGLAVMAPPTPFIRAALTVVVVFAVVAFFLGLRGEVLFPLAVAGTVRAFRHRAPRMTTTISASLVALTLISAAKIVRQLGVRESGLAWTAADPLSALAEMGSSLRVVATTVIWHNVNGEPFRGGDTYTASIARLGEALFSPLSRPPGYADFRLMNSEVMARSGGIGGSIVAEAFHNFALPGVVVMFLAIGMLFGYFSSMKLTATGIAIYVCAAVPLFNHVRNSFIPVIPAFVACSLVLLAVRVVGDIVDPRPQQARRGRPVSREHSRAGT